MSLNRSVLQPTNNTANNPQTTNLPDYAGLVRFLIQPFLESSSSLSVDCEALHNKTRFWIRVAFEGEDKGRVFGRGGRNIQSIRTVVAAAAALTGHSVYVDIYGSQAFSSTSNDEEAEHKLAPVKPAERGTSVSKPNIKPRSL